MDPMISLGQKNTLAEYMILSGADNRPPMLDKDLTKKYAELSTAEKIKADCDMKATNIILQGLPADIYSLVNHHRVAKDLWERVQLLMQGTSLTRQEREFAYQSPQAHTQPMTESPFGDSSFAIPVFSPRDDLIAYPNKAMAFLTAVASSSTTYKSNATSSRGNTTSGQARVVRCYNCQGKGHMARQCTQPKRPRNAAWYKEKAMLAEAQEAGQILDEEQLAFLADPGIPENQAQTIIPQMLLSRLRISIRMSQTVMISRLHKRFLWPTFPTMVLTLSK
ncbi:retrovirus-related pol polyprotein from transposon TNT 1-94, partial [Tanacetum coccineum]